MTQDYRSLPTSLTPVFITGCPRSGTTMLASQLARADRAFALPEMQYIYPLLGEETEAPPAPEDAERAWRRLAGDFRFQVSKIPAEPAAFRRVYSEQGARCAIFYLIDCYLSAHRPDLPLAEATHWVEHAPLSRNYLGLIGARLPRARFVHIVRDPRSTYLSMRNLRRWNVWDPLRFAAIWSDAVGKCERLCRTCPDRTMRVRYEDVVTDPETALRRLCAGTGLPFRDAMLEGGGVDLPGFTVAQHALTQGPPVARRLDRWRAEIAPREAELIEAALGDWMVEFGYLDRPRFVRPASKREEAVYVLRRALKTPGSLARGAALRILTRLEGRGRRDRGGAPPQADACR